MKIAWQVIAYVVLVLLVAGIWFSGIAGAPAFSTNRSVLFFYAYLFVFENFVTILIPSVLAIAYTAALYFMLHRQEKWQLKMIIHALLVMFLPLSAVTILGMNGYLDLMGFTARTMFATGLLTILLSFLLKLKEKADGIHSKKEASK